MATKVVCDRCDEECEGCGWRVHTWEESLEHGKPNETRDLCARCVKELEKWLGNVPRRTAAAEEKTLRQLNEARGEADKLVRQWEDDADSWDGHDKNVPRILRNCAKQLAQVIPTR